MSPKSAPLLGWAFFLLYFCGKGTAMAKVIKYHFYLKDKNSSKPTPINFSVCAGGVRKRMGIGESILPQWWDNENECAIESTRQKKTEKALARRVNKNLNRLRRDLDDLFEEYSAINKLTPNHTEGEDYLITLFQKTEGIINNQIETETKEELEARRTPTLFFEEFIRRWSHTPNNRTGIVPKAETIWNYQNTVRRYKEFITDNGLKDTFAIFNEDFQAKFDDYLLNEQELSMNTIVGSHSQLKTMLRVAKEKGYLQDTSFLRWTSKAINFTHVFLTDEEINRLYNLKLTKKIRQEYHIGNESHIEESLALFIVSARTGLRYSDLRHLDTALWNMEDGKETLTILIRKTNDRLSIPLHHQVIAIYNKYNGNMPAVVDKSSYNEHIRLCARIAEINQQIEAFVWKKGRPIFKVFEKYELISSHTGRRSFATNLYLVCKSPHYVMNLTGHKTEENFKRYICVNQSEMAEMVRKFINLDKNVDAESTEAYERFVRTLKQDAVTIHEQEKEITGLQQKVESQKIMTAIEEMQKQDAQAETENQRIAWGMGLTLDEYEEVKQKEDEITAIIDSQEANGE